MVAVVVHVHVVNKGRYNQRDHSSSSSSASSSLVHNHHHDQHHDGRHLDTRMLAATCPAQVYEAISGKQNVATMTLA